MCKDASDDAIDHEVRGVRLGPVNAFMARRSLGMLRRRAYTVAQFEHLAAASAFRTCDVRADGIGLEVRLRKKGVA